MNTLSSFSNLTLKFSPIRTLPQVEYFYHSRSDTKDTTLNLSYTLCEQENGNCTINHRLLLSSVLQLWMFTVLHLCLPTILFAVMVRNGNLQNKVKSFRWNLLMILNWSNL